MHTHKQTLLSRMGFADPDKKNARHDAACRYIAEQREFFEKLLRIPRPEELTEEERQTKVEYRLTLEQECVVGNGACFVDLFAESTYRREDTPGWWGRKRVIVEVKISPVPVGDVLRQLKLYRTKLKRSAYLMLVVDYGLTELEQQALSSEGVIVAQLGQKFDEWLRNQSNRPVDLPTI